jgi:hypothetical protein
LSFGCRRAAAPLICKAAFNHDQYEAEIVQTDLDTHSWFLALNLLSRCLIFAKMVELGFSFGDILAAAELVYGIQ